MTREEFIEVLEEKGYSYKIKGDKIVVTDKGRVHLNSLKTLPPDVHLNNEGSVFLNSLKTLPPGVEFNNKDGDVKLGSLKTLHPGVVFNNEGDVYLPSLKSIPPGVVFNNGEDVNLGSLTGDYFYKWNGLIKGIAPNTLLNGMIKRGIFL